MLRMTKDAVIIFAVFLCVSLCGCAKEGSAPCDIVAFIGEDVISLKECEEEIAALPPYYRSMAISNKQQFLDSLINKHLLLEEAERLHLEKTDSVKRLLQMAKDEIMIQELIGRNITDKIKVDESDIKKYYEANKEKYMEPAKTRASHILADSLLVAQKILSDLRAGADFAALCREYSLDPKTKENDGDTGYFVKDTFPPEFEEACDKLNVGEMSDVIKTSLGYHIIKVTERKEPAPRPLEDMKNEIEGEIFVEKQIALYDELMKKLKEGKDIKINNTVFDKISFE